ncbi:nuclear transport factor 2 family protein [Streptomyces sp. NBC_00083]|uniref:nuclear transport factor 2 family protein n=1 Tax=Streptomyces sp. NBC_00083 TaxID=2975647 RepID=UPI002256D163|nr:nuclear transport factor 2 family protein [Streptomyces sp. NBC_00083]MCX5386663.1 nuclear transport factor 2 family protein [Streptomyces sp. NBC_00083]
MSNHAESVRDVQLVRDYIENIWNEGLTGRADEYLAEHLIQHNPNLPDGRKPLVDFIDGFREQLPEARFEIRRTAGEGGLVFAHSHFRPEPGHRGVVVVDIFRIEDGRIVEHWDVREDVPETTLSGNEVH